MFNNTVSQLTQSSNFASAQKRVEQIESLITEKTKSLSSPAIEKKKEVSAFSEILKQKPSEPLKYKVADPAKLTKADIQNMVSSTSHKHNVDEKLVMAIIKQESAFNPNAVSTAGAKGLMQLMPGTAKEVGVLNPFSPSQNIEGGVRYLKNMLKKYNGNIILALSAYNAGPANVDKYGGIPPFKETQNYVKNILSNYLG